ncbi:MAG: phage shock protein operon transcriptional activator [Inquilinaceae bacterium]
MLEHVSAVAPLSKPVLIIGERGTGKELIAARLHYLSRRWDRPFVKLNCATLSEELLESELFGHEAGAFTGATRRHVGRFERADGGTLFLDEIAAASLRVQEKVLRAVEYGEIERVGGAVTLNVDVRLIGATNVDLPARVAAGAFRADLLDRLAFDVVTLPPLRARPDDIVLLAESFASAMAAELGRPRFSGFAPSAVEALKSHDWPGNVRELKNAVERAVYRTGARQLVADLVLDPFESPFRPDSGADAPAGREGTAPGDSIRSPGNGEPHAAATGFKARLEALEVEMLTNALEKSKHNQKKAAASLGLSYDQIRGYLRKHGLSGR